MHIYISKLTIIGSDNGLLPGRCQAIIWTNTKILLTGPLGTNFSEILIKNHIFSFKQMHLKMSSAKRQQICLGVNICGSEVGMFHANQVNTIAFYALAPPVVKSSSAQLLTLLTGWSFLAQGCKLLVTYQSDWMTKCKWMFMLSKKNHVKNWYILWSSLHHHLRNQWQCL